MRNPVQTCLNLSGICPSRGELNLSKNRARAPPTRKTAQNRVVVVVNRGPRDMSKARVAAFEAALTDRVHLGADNYGPVVGRTTRAMGDGRTLQQTRCHCGSIWDGHTWGPGKKEWEAHVGSMKHLAWVQSRVESASNLFNIYLGSEPVRNLPPSPRHPRPGPRRTHPGNSPRTCRNLPGICPPAGRDQAGLDGVPQELVRT